MGSTTTAYSKPAKQATPTANLWPLPARGGIEVEVASFSSPVFRASYRFVVVVGTFAGHDGTAHVLILGGRYRTDALVHKTGSLVPILATRSSLIVNVNARTAPPALVQVFRHVSEIVQKVAAEEEAAARREERRRAGGF